MQRFCCTGCILRKKFIALSLELEFPSVTLPSGGECWFYPLVANQEAMVKRQFSQFSFMKRTTSQKQFRLGWLREEFVPGIALGSHLYLGVFPISERKCAWRIEKAIVGSDGVGASIDCSGFASLRHAKIVLLIKMDFR